MKCEFINSMRRAVSRTWIAVVLLSTLSTLCPMQAQAQTAPASPCPDIVANCTEDQALAAATEWLNYYKAYYPPSRNPTLHHVPASPGSEFAQHTVRWESGDYQAGTYHVSWYRATTFPGLPVNPCGTWANAVYCTRADAISIANRAYEHKVLESPDGAWLVNLDQFIPSINQGYYCVRRTQPGWAAGCYFAVYFQEYSPHYDPDSNLGNSCQNVTCGNPINFGIGNKYQYELDLKTPGLEFARYYNSDRGARNEDLGPHWTHTYSRSVTMSESGGVQLARITRPDGSAVRFQEQGAAWKPAIGHKGSLQELVDAGGTTVGWLFSAGNSSDVERFDGAGRLVSIQRTDGTRLDLHYQNVNVNPPEKFLLVRVTDDLGRSLHFSYTPGRLIGQVIDDSGAGANFLYGSLQQLEEVVYGDGSSRTYLYNEPSHTQGAVLPWALTGIVDENGARFATFKFDTVGRAVSTEHAGSVQSHSVSYPATNRAIVTTPSGSLKTTSLQAINGKMLATLAIEQCSGCTLRTTSYSYDASGELDVVTETDGSATSYDFDAAGNLTRLTEGLGESVLNVRTSEVDWNTIARRPTERRIISSAGVVESKETWTHNERGQVLTSSLLDPTSPSERMTGFAYCETADVSELNSTCPVLGHLKSVDGPQIGSNDTAFYAYYPANDLTGCASTGPCHRKGDLHTVTAPGGLTVTYARYDLAGRAAQVLDANGVATDLEYNSRGWLTARKVRGIDQGTETDDAITRIEYDYVGQVTKIIQPDGAFLAFTYDAAHRLIGIADNSGNTVTYTLDGTGHRIAEETRDAGNVLRNNLSRVYDQLGQLVTLADALSTPTDFTYDAVGQVDTITDAFGRVTDNDYDPLGRLKLSIANVGGVGPERAETRFEYDALDRVTTVVDPKGLTTAYTYNGLGDLIELDSPDTGTTTYTYDSAGNRTGQLDARGVQTNYSYDALNRLTRVDLPTAGQDIDFAYDAAPAVCQANETFAAGRLSGYTDGSGSTSYCHDRHGNVVRKVQSVAGAPDATVAYAYSPAGRVMAVNYPSGATVSYLRDAGGRITGVLAKPTVSAAEVAVVSDVDYLPFGPATQYTFGNGRVLAKAFDQNYGIAGITDSAMDGMDLDYTLDAVGNVTGLAERLTGGNTASRTIDYDGLDRLTALKDGASALQAFTYDATGNRTSKTAGTTEAYTYPTDSHRLTEVGGVARGYDAAGNTTAIGANRAILYDDRGRLAQLTDGGVPIREYAYNARGERVAKRNPTVSGGDITYVYDESGHLLGEYDASGLRIKEYVWLDDTLVAVLGDHGGSDHQYVLTDHLGTPRAVVHPGSNALLWRWDLTASAFGDHPAQLDPDGDGATYGFNLRYPGQYFDAESGMHYNYFRDYDPSAGRYVKSDPIGLADGPSTYAYVSGKPFNAMDSLGLFMEYCRDDSSLNFRFNVAVEGNEKNQAVIDGMLRAAGAAWSGTAVEPGIFFDGTISVSTQVVNSSLPNASRLRISSGSGSASAGAGGTGSWYSEMSNQVIAHETGHFFGIPRWDTHNGLHGGDKSMVGKSIMSPAAPGKPESPTARDFQMLEATFDKTSEDCKCEGW
ncbi:MAG: hypothetical protein K0M64_03895 [Rhizobium sp.]|nr:hypothetical protein [Rhizobium sp.]